MYQVINRTDIKTTLKFDLQIIRKKLFISKKGLSRITYHFRNIGKINRLHIISNFIIKMLNFLFCDRGFIIRKTKITTHHREWESRKPM